MSDNELLYTIALGMIPGVGDIYSKLLIDRFGSAEKVLKQPFSSLTRIQGIGRKIATSLKTKQCLANAEKELSFISKNGIMTLYYRDDNYPRRLKECADSPMLLYYKGNADLDSRKIISMVGTRNITRRGKDICRSIIRDLASAYPDVIIVSGLAYGVDIQAHRESLEYGLKTVGVFAHGFATVYPSEHAELARKMISHGGLLTDFSSAEPPNRNNFLKRNRIIAGLSDATILIESDTRGGAMVTADIASSYDREVMAIPGFPGEKYSAGCNLLIKSNRASMLESLKDIEYQLHWANDRSDITQQPELFMEISPLESRILDLFHNRDIISGEEIGKHMETAPHRLASVMLKLEFEGLIENIPGNLYRKII